MAKNQKSISDEVCAYISKQKLLPIPVQTLNEEVEATRYFGGDLKEFIAAAKSLNAKSIFVETLYLEEDEFFYDSGIDDEEYLAMNGADSSCCCCCGDDCKCGCKDDKKASKKSKKEEDGVWLEPEDLDGLDLSLLKPEMVKYMDRIGESCGVRLTVPGVDHLEVEIFADWYDEFAELVDEASEIIEEDPVGALEDMQAAFEKAEEEAEAAEKAAKAADKAKGVKKIAAHPPKKTAKA
ncbi:MULTISPECIES: hypothetical protein [unclassified Fibrobacter]|uniref:hypothetical protein n=1 Tax=unclassified Fibrobacter TaxID=2634177 RepID=UPI000D6B6372|nr:MULTISPECIES: hypothetical protein [unclassified Fibrobacter]PWJ61584.1 hypothetical protein BGX12_1266 [Fibrobacter sp. UWR4]PZW74018.1 hypothetical protein C8E88_100137 [Fibrobacter sp. UWR1]